MNELKYLDTETLYKLRDYINCKYKGTLHTKQNLMDMITRELTDRILMKLIKPLVKGFKEERGE